MSNFVEARAAYDEARNVYHKAIKDEIREGLEELFADESVDNVMFGIATTPFNDENPGIGVFGPKVNAMERDEDGDFPEIESDYQGPGYELFYSYENPPRAGKLLELFKVVDSLAVADAFDMRYDEQGGETRVYVASRTEDGYFDLNSYSVEGS